MPGATAGQADVGAADPHPAVLLRGGDQRGENIAVGGLEGGALGKCAPRLRDARRERVAHLLQLAQPEQPRRPRGLDPVRHDDPAEPLGDEPAELPLQLADLPAQLGASQPLVDQPSVLCRPPGDKGQPVRLPFKQIRHRQILSGLEGGGGNP